MRGSLLDPGRRRVLRSRAPRGSRPFRRRTSGDRTSSRIVRAAGRSGSSRRGAALAPRRCRVRPARPGAGGDGRGALEVGASERDRRPPALGGGAGFAADRRGDPTVGHTGRVAPPPRGQHDRRGHPWYGRGCRRRNRARPEASRSPCRPRVQPVTGRSDPLPSPDRRTGPYRRRSTGDRRPTRLSRVSDCRARMPDLVSSRAMAAGRPRVISLPPTDEKRS